MLSGRASASRPRSGGGGIDVGDAVVVLGSSADVEVGAERAGDLLGEERAERLAR